MKRSLYSLPVVVGLVGVAAGWFTRPDGDTARPDTPAVQMRTDVALDGAAGDVGLVPATLPISTDGLVGLDTLDTDVADLAGVGAGGSGSGASGTGGAGAELRLPTTIPADGTGAAPSVVDPATGAPAPDPAPPAPSSTEEPPAPLGDGTPTDTAPTPTEAPDGEPGEPGEPGETPETPDFPGIGDAGAPAFIDPCVRSQAGCPSGVPAVVRDPLKGGLDQRILPVEVSQPFPAVGQFALLCAVAEGNNVPDPDLFPSQRPTVAVLVSQPMDLQLMGTWPDGTSITPLAMRIAASHEAAWRANIDAGRGQGTLVACATVPRANVEAHADGRVAHLQSTVVVQAGEASFSTSALTDLNVPSNADQVALMTPRITSLGERNINGRLVPAVNVHFEYLLTVPGQPDPADPTGAPPTADDVGMSAVFTQRGACASWANGTASPDAVFTPDRSILPSNWHTRQEQRTVNGRQQMVEIVDYEVFGDYDMSSGWEGEVCVALYTTGSRQPVGVWAATARAPRTPEFQVSVGMGDLNPDWRVEVEAPCRTNLSNGFLDDGTATGVWGRAGADCGRISGRGLVDGLFVRARVVDSVGFARQWFQARIPVNLEYCNGDDVWSAIVGGCDQSTRTYTFEVPLGSGYPQPDTVTLSVGVTRFAQQGVNFHVNPDPSHQWRIGGVERIA